MRSVLQGQSPRLRISTAASCIAPTTPSAAHRQHGPHAIPGRKTDGGYGRKGSGTRPTRADRVSLSCGARRRRASPYGCTRCIREQPTTPGTGRLVRRGSTGMPETGHRHRRGATIRGRRRDRVTGYQRRDLSGAASCNGHRSVVSGPGFVCCWVARTRPTAHDELRTGAVVAVAESTSDATLPGWHTSKGSPQACDLTTQLGLSVLSTEDWRSCCSRVGQFAT